MSIQIFLDNCNTDACFPGQTISGRVECIFNKKTHLRAIRVKFFGRSSTSWSETESYHDSTSNEDKTRSVDYSAEEIYMKTEYNLFTGDRNFSLPAGKYVYPISYILPSELPSSFEGSVGNIRYFVTAVVDRPWKKYEAKVFLNVVSLIDLNLIPGLQEPVAISDDKTMCSCWCNDSGALTFNLSLPISGYYPGQTINIGAYIQNLTNISVKRVNFKVVAHYQYIAHISIGTKRDSDEIVKCVEGGVGAHGEKSWTSILVIPTDRVYPNLIPCSIINLHYSLMAEVVLPGPRMNMKLEIPITIGSLALSDVNTTIPGPPLYDDQFSLSFNNSNGYYSKKYSDGVSRSHLLGGGANAPFAPLGEPSLYSPGVSAPSLEVVSSYPPSARRSPPYHPTSYGSIPFHASPPTCEEKR